MVQKFIVENSEVEKSGVENFMVENSVVEKSWSKLGVEKSEIEMSFNL